MDLRLLAIIALTALAACKAEPDFNDAYQAEAQRLDQAAANMQAALNDQLNAANAAGALPTTNAADAR